MHDTIKSLQARCLPLDPAPLMPVHDSHAYTPELAERLDRDPNLSDGARRCARIIAAYTYRRARTSRRAEITVTWIAARMDVCRRTAQRYLRQLEHAGYITVTVCASRVRMCIGIIIELLTPLFPGHHAKAWPQTREKPAATIPSHNYSFKIKYREFSRAHFAAKVQDGLFRSLMNKIPPPPPLL